MKGFHGKLLIVDLSSHSVNEEAIPQEILRSYLGGKGLGSYLLLKNVAAGTDPLGPDNRVIFTVGPATGTRVPGASRHGMFSKSPLTGGYAESYSGGKVAPRIKAAGYDAVILEGRSKKPVLLEISDRGVKFHPACDLWGRETYAAEDAALERVGVPGAQAVVIGPAGENLVRLACVENNYWRSAGRGGMGAVLGSKNVKGIVFHGETPAEVADEAALKGFAKKLTAACKDLPGVKNYRKYGTAQMVSLLNTARAFPTRYWSRGVLEGWEKIAGETLLSDFDVRPRACPNCFLTCGNLTTVRSGRHSGLTIEGPEYETIYAIGGLCCIDRLDEIIYLNDLCDRLGLDTISAGNLVALAMEARERGFDAGFPAYGDALGAAALLEEMALRKGRGAVLADGIVRAAKALGLEEAAVHVRGMEPPGYDPRVLKGVGLGYATSARGACHLRATFYKPELAGIIPPSTIEGKAALYVDYEDRLTIFNTLIVCVFYRDMLQWPELQEIIRAITGLDYSVEELRRTAGNIIGLTRRFNVNEDMGRRCDVLPARLHTQPLPESNALVTREELERMLQDYYSLRSWDREGNPAPDTGF
ncbi:MAG: aldehyde ferredoxin oxidoreductase family protein [Eubacteriales bacterium]